MSTILALDVPQWFKKELLVSSKWASDHALSIWAPGEVADSADELMISMFVDGIISSSQEIIGSSLISLRAPCEVPD